MRTIEAVNKDIDRLCKQIHAALESKMPAKDKRIVMEGFALQKDKLDKERARLLGNPQTRVFNCKVGKSVPIPELHNRAGVQELKTTDTCRK